MKQLGTQVIQTTRSGNYQYAKVESFNRALVTVRLGSDGSGARLTNLNVVGSPSVGDIVIVDYSTNVPYVRTQQSIRETQNPLLFAPTPLELSLPTENEICDPYSLASGQVFGKLAILPGDTYSFGTPVYITSQGRTAAASAQTISTAKVIGMSASGDDIYLREGCINNSSWSMTPGEYVFLGVYGGITQSKPTGTDNAVVILGIALSSTILLFKPELVIVELL